MMNPICISTGCIYRLSDDRNELIKIIKGFSPDGIELSFAYPEYLFNFAITPENLEYIKSLKFVSIHAPMFDIVYGDNQRSREVLKLIEKLYKQVGARNVVFHKDEVEDISEITKYDFTASLENGDYRKTIANSPEKIQEILSRNPKLMFTFDLAHALSINGEDVPVYLEKFKRKLAEIHMSWQNKNPAQHDFICKYDSPGIRKSLKSVDIADVPLVLEAGANNEAESRLLVDEIKYLKSI